MGCTLASGKKKRSPSHSRSSHAELPGKHLFLKYSSNHRSLKIPAPKDRNEVESINHLNKCSSQFKQTSRLTQWNQPQISTKEDLSSKSHSKPSDQDFSDYRVLEVSMQSILEDCHDIVCKEFDSVIELDLSVQCFSYFHDCNECELRFKDKIVNELSIISKSSPVHQSDDKFNSQQQLRKSSFELDPSDFPEYKMFNEVDGLYSLSNQ